uniref:Uncharacterized protein n=1 Tax=Anguilla anguilla TaxID=7936 RepID=A0A0E9QI27_ANGAN
MVISSALDSGQPYRSPVWRKHDSAEKKQTGLLS